MGTPAAFLSRYTRSSTSQYQAHQVTAEKEERKCSHRNHSEFSGPILLLDSLEVMKATQDRRNSEIPEGRNRSLVKIECMTRTPPGCKTAKRTEKAPADVSSTDAELTVTQRLQLPDSNRFWKRQTSVNDTQVRTVLMLLVTETANLKACPRRSYSQ